MPHRIIFILILNQAISSDISHAKSSMVKTISTYDNDQYEHKLVSKPQSDEEIVYE